MNKLWFYVTSNWQTALTAGVASLFIVCLLFFKIGSLTPGASSVEVSTESKNHTLHSIKSDPVNAPFYVFRNIIGKFHHKSITTDRRVTAVFALGLIVGFYILLSFWYNLRVATLGTLLFASSSWLLRTGRIGTPEILQTAIIIPIIISVWLMRTKRRHLVLVLLTICAALMIYVPGLVWLLVLAVGWRAGPFFLEIKKLPKWLLPVCVVMFLILISPIILASFSSPKTLLTIAGLPSHFDFVKILSNLWQIPLAVIVRSDLSPQISIAHLPLLDIFSASMAIIGFYSCIRNWGLDRNKLVIATLAVGYVLASLGGPVSIAILLPLIYLLITAGISFMLNDWFRVFPRNPLAGNIGASLMTVAVLLTMFYHINNYFIAWPHVPATKIEFSKRL